MSTRPARHELLDEVYERLKRCGPRYLAALLVAEAYQNECLANIAFNAGNADDAAIKVSQRFRPFLEAPPAAPGKPKRATRRAAALAEALAARGLNLDGDRVTEAP